MDQPGIFGPRQSLTYARAQIDASAYHPVSDRIVSPGAFGSGRSSAPASSTSRRRGASIRAAADRCAATATSSSGPRTSDGDPIGGRGLAEFALEARIRLKQFGGNFGVVPFFDGGSLTTKAMPDFAQLAVRGRASGVRYYSSFGPIRIDLGVPLNRQKGDGPFAVTVSLGQAF